MATKRSQRAYDHRLVLHAQETRDPLHRAPDASAHPEISDVRRDLLAHLHRPFGS